MARGPDKKPRKRRGSAVETPASEVLHVRVPRWLGQWYRERDLYSVEIRKLLEEYAIRTRTVEAILSEPVDTA